MQTSSTQMVTKANSQTPPDSPFPSGPIGTTRTNAARLRGHAETAKDRDRLRARIDDIAPPSSGPKQRQRQAAQASTA